MILSGVEIKKEIDRGRIKIDPFSEKQLNPNSYNLRLNNKLLVYSNSPLDSSKKNDTQELIIPDSGLILDPGELYLARTEEYTETESFVPMLNGRSSIGRLGLFVHITAGFGDVGFRGCWTLELTAVKPVKVFPLMQICQIYYQTIQGDYTQYNSGKYNGNHEVQASRLWQEFA